MKIIKTTFFTLILSTIFLPFFASAQGFPPVGFLPIIDPSSGCLMTGNIGFVICKLSSVFNSIIPLLVALGVVYFVWGVITYVINDSEEAKKKGKDRIIYGIIGFVVIVGLWGLVSIVVNTFGLRGVSSPDISSLSEGIINSSDGLCNLNSTNPKLQDLLSYITCIIGKSVIPLIFVLAVAMFVWGVVQYVINDSEEAKKKGKNFMIWGIIALTVMVSVWGLVAIVGTTFNIDTGFVPRLKE